MTIRVLIQHLTGLIPICQDCHLSMHLGRANQLGLGDKAQQHLASVNQWTARQTDIQIKEAFEKWMLRSQNQYSLDLSLLNQWIPQSKATLIKYTDSTGHAL